jgi:cation diffusion facilitator family transporter
MLAGFPRKKKRISLQQLQVLTANVPPRLLVYSALQIGLVSGEYLYALFLSSIALRAHALVVASDCLQTVCKVVALMLRDTPADSHFSYGYGRYAVLVEYAGAVLLGFVTFTLCLEAMLRLKHHSALFQGLQGSSAQATIITHDVSLPFVLFAILHTITVLLVPFYAKSFRSGFGLANNYPAGALHVEYRASLLRGCGGVLGPRSREFFGISRKNVLLAISVLASVSLAVSGMIMHWSGAVAIDAAACAVLCVMLLPMVVSLLLSSAPLLLQRSPAGPRAAFDKGLREVATLEGVVDCRKERLWEHSPGVFVGTITVRVRRGEDTKEMLARIRGRFAAVCTHLTVQIDHSEEH